MPGRILAGSTESLPGNKMQFPFLFVITESDETYTREALIPNMQEKRGLA